MPISWKPLALGRRTTPGGEPGANFPEKENVVTWGRVEFVSAKRRISVDVPHLLVLSCIVGFCLWYLNDARSASDDIQNLLLIEPAAVLALIFAALVVPEIIVVSRTQSPPARFEREPIRPGKGMKIAGSMVALGVYVSLMGSIGFDVATALYVFGSLLVLGERRPLVLTVVPIAFTAVTIYGFKTIVPIPLPLFFG